jgi:hypothetical protein
VIHPRSPGHDPNGHSWILDIGLVPRVGSKHRCAAVDGPSNPPCPTFWTASLAVNVQSEVASPSSRDPETFCSAATARTRTRTRYPHRQRARARLGGIQTTHTQRRRPTGPRQGRPNTRHHKARTDSPSTATRRLPPGRAHTTAPAIRRMACRRRAAQRAARGPALSACRRECRGRIHLAQAGASRRGATAVTAGACRASTRGAC